MTLTVSQLLAASPPSIAELASTWSRLAKLLLDRATTVDRVLRQLRTAWSGPAADAAADRLNGLRAELESRYPELLEIEQALHEHTETLARAQWLAVAALSSPTPTSPNGLAFNSSPFANPSPRGSATGGGTGGGGAVGGVGAGVGGAVGAAVGVALELAERSDREAAARLGGLVPVPPDGVRAADPPAGGSPAAVAAWWSGLTPVQREWLIAARPERIGGLDGVPAGARDAANRVLLARALARDPHDPGLTAVAARLAAAGPRAYLLALSTSGQGRAVLALGDPDQAGNVVTYVPGTGAGLEAAGADLTRGDRLLTAARSAAPGEGTSVVVWIGYDAPPDLLRATDVDPAADAGPALRQFQSGLLATHQGGPVHRTVLGWSYGSTVVGLAAAGAAAHGDRLADDLVLVGSPGVGVAHAADLGVGTGHVWATTAAHDVINAATDPLELARPDLNPLFRPLFGEHTGHEWFGRSPVDPAFGGQVFASDPGSGLHPVAAHESYFDPGGRALTAMAGIAVGDYALTRP